MKKAFTLIELLVVVLIIGILAAIALPQYKTAIAKTRFMEIVAMANNLYQAQKRYYMVNNTYSKDLNSLDIQMPKHSETTASTKWGSCNINYNLDEGTPTLLGCHLTVPDVFYGINYSVGIRSCYSYSSDNFAADQLCKNVFGGEGVPGCNGNCHIWTQH